MSKEIDIREKLSNFMKRELVVTLVKNAVQEYVDEMDYNLNEHQIEKVANYMTDEHSLMTLEQNEIEEILETDAIEQALDFFSNEFLFEE